MTSPDVVETWERLVRFHRTTTNAMDDNLRRTFGHTLDDYDILHQISRHDGPIRMGDLAKRLLFANSSCHRLVAKLVDADLIQRHHDEADRRVVLVQLTSKGKRLRRRMAATHTKDILGLVGEPLCETDLAALDTALTQLSKTSADGQR
jgi:DNA-binding MarR family transcriptional regulator